MAVSNLSNNNDIGHDNHNGHKDQRRQSCDCLGEISLTTHSVSPGVPFVKEKFERSKCKDCGFANCYHGKSEERDA